MTAKKIHQDQKYIEALAKNDSSVVAEIYKKFAPKVIGYICKNSGDESDAYDIVQETLITLYDQAKVKGLELTCPFDAYFFLICKRKWFNVLKKRGYKTVTIEEERLSISDDTAEQAAETQKFEARKELYLSVLSKLGKTCQKLIKLSLTKLSMKEVAEKLEITYGYARKKKSVCMGKLSDLIKENPRYQNLKL